MAFEQVVNAPNLYVDGLNIARASDSTLTIGTGECRDATDTVDLTVDAALTVDGAVVGANGIDTGSIGASKLYYVFLIGDSRKYNDPAGLISLSDDPVMPSGYDVKRVIGYMSSDGTSDLIEGYWYGDRNERVFAFDAPQATAVTAGAATSFTAVDLSALVPPIENLPVSIAYEFTPGAASRELSLTPGNATGTAVLVTGQVTSVVVSGNAEVMAKVTSDVPEIDYKVSNSGDAVAINVAGFRVSL